MKKILFVVMFWVGLAHAGQVNHVWIPFPGGSLETQCRALWNEYDIRHQTKTMFFVKPGADGLVATQEMLNHAGSRKFMCGGSGQVVSNPLVHADAMTDRIEALIQTAVNTMVWYVPRNNTARTLPELIAYFKSLDRPVNIGVFFAGQRGIVNYLEKVYNVKVNMVMYRTGPQMYPDLASGALDLGFDTGGAIDLATHGNKFRILGYLANNDYERLKGYPNFRNSGADLPLYFQWLGIFVTTDMNTETKQTVTKELQAIVQQKTFRDLATQNLSTVTGIGQPDITALVVRQRRLLERNWK